MEDINENDVIMYEESKEIKETIWDIWDLINDKEIVTKLLTNSTLLKELEKLQTQNNININDNNNSFKDRFVINIEDIQFDYHLKIIAFKIESSLLFNKNLNIDKSSNSESKSANNSYKNKSEKTIPQICSNNRQNTNINFIKLIFTIQPNTLEETKLLTITMIDFSETLNESQLKDIILSIFNNFKDIIIKEVPLTKNCESIIINANINIVFDFWENWKFKYLNEKIITNVKMEGEPNKSGSRIHFFFLDKYSIISEIIEINKFFQEGNEDDNNEWNYKFRITYENEESETYNAIFVSCENGTKTYISLENNINEKIKVKKITEYTSRKLVLLNSIKNFIENNNK
jgi:hypothetical protein